MPRKVVSVGTRDKISAGVKAYHQRRRDLRVKLQAIKCMLCESPELREEVRAFLDEL